jgi:two-component system chemotaxis sensor kinase CheA
MAKKKDINQKSRRIANVSSVLMIFIISGLFLLETWLADIKINMSFAGLVMILALFVVVSILRNTINKYKLAFNVPFVIFLFVTTMMMMSGWHSNYYLLVCLALCAISCTYFSFYRTVVFVILMNVFIALLVLRGVPVAGQNVPMYVMLISWSVLLFGGLILLVTTKSATLTLNKAREHQNSFKNLLDTTENFVAMIDDRNQVIYASKSLSMMSNIQEPDHVQGRPLIDLFPGRGLKIHAGKMLREKQHYAEDWEFSLNGQKRYFKTVSHILPGEDGGTLISMYDMTHLAERDEIAAMKDSMKIGLFIMDKNNVIQDHYSRYLEEMLSEEKLFGRLFTDIIADSVMGSELEAIKDYFKMVVEGSYDQDMLEDINPLSQLRYVNARTEERKVFQCTFSTLERGHGEIFILVTIYDITARVELQERLAEEESRRQEEMQSVFELIQVEPDVFGDFSEDMDHEFTTIDKTLKDEGTSTHEALVKVYQSVHAIKSNAVILGLNIFGNKLHRLESKIKKMREMQEAVPFAEMLNLAVDIDKISQERERFKEIIEKLQSYGGESEGGEKQNLKVMVESLAKCASKASEDMGKQVKFIASDIDPEAINVGPRRIMKEILMQLIRNSAVHGIELPDVRVEKGKSEVGIVKLSIKMSEDKKTIQVKLSDDGKGLDYKKIAERAISNNLIKKEEAGNTEMLNKAIFLPGFSTAEVEGVHAGRGIGLNLVKDRVKEINGVIKLRTEAEKGTLFFVSIPVPKPQPKPGAPKPQPQKK